MYNIKRGNNTIPDDGEYGRDDSEEAVIAHAKALGIDPEADREYLWIAEEALLADLGPWQEMYDQQTCKTYYYNETTNESSWDNPIDEYYRKMFARIQQENQQQYQQQHMLSSPGNMSKREMRLKKELEREREHYKAKKFEWHHKEAKMIRQSKKREQMLKKERDEWRLKLQALERSQFDQGDDTRSISTEMQKRVQELDEGYQKEISKLEAELSKCRLEMCKLGETNQGLEKKHANLLIDLEKVTAVAEAHGLGVSHLNAKSQEADIELQKTRLELELARENITELREENKALYERLGSGSGGQDVVGLEKSIRNYEHELRQESTKRKVLESALENVQSTCSELQSSLVDAESLAAQTKREMYFCNFEKKHLEEELISRRLSCSCGFNSRLNRQTKSKKKKVQTEEIPGSLSDPENMRTALHNSGRTTRRIISESMNKAKSLEDEIVEQKQRHARENQNGAQILRMALISK